MKIGKLAIILSIIGVFISTQVAPAPATTTGFIVFFGDFTVTTGLWSPINPLNPTDCTPLCPGAQSPPGAGWTLTTISASGEQHRPFCCTSGGVFGGISITISGELDAGTFGLGAWCGYSSGRNGSGAITSSGISTPLSKVRWHQSVGNWIVFEGQAGESPGTISGIMSMEEIPTPPGGSNDCFQGEWTTGFTDGAAIFLATNP